MVTATQCLSVSVVLETHTVTWTLTPHILLHACLCGRVAAHSHSRTGARPLFDSVDTACERVRDYNYVIVSTHTVSVTLLCGCVAVIVHATRGHSLTHANSVTQCDSVWHRVWRSV
jgi:hypothetical protein